MKKYVLVIMLSTLALLTACKSSPPPLYYHGNYQAIVYSYFTGDDVSIEQQIQSMEELIQKAQASGLAIAPGVHAHLGLLYFDSGNPDRGTAHFNQEKTLFPESAAYIDFLLSNNKGATNGV